MIPEKRTRRNISSSTSRTSVSNQQKSVRHVSNMFMSRAGNLWGAKKRRTLRIPFKDKDYNEDANSTNRLTRGDSNKVGGKVDECLKGNNSLDCNTVSKDCILPSEDANVSAEYTSTTHNETNGILERVQSDCYREETSQKCVGNDKGENLTPKRKSTVMDNCSDVTATLVDDDYRNLIERPRCNAVYTRGSSKRIRRSSNVDQPTSKSTEEKSCARIMEDSDKPHGNNVEAEKIRSQQKSLHLSLKPEISKLCEILLLPDNVKSMVGKILEYIMNNRQICAESVTILQAFQLSLCFTAASLLNHKIDIEASLILAKNHLNFDCKKDAVDEINAMLCDLREKFLSLKENAEVTGSPKAFESSTMVHSNAFLMPYVESTETYVSGTINESQKRKNQWRKLLQMQLEIKNNLKKDFETKEADFAKRYKIELGAYKKFYVMTKEMLNDYKAEYFKRLAELKRKHEVRLQAFENNKLEVKKKYRESWTLDEVLETRPVNLIEPQEQVHLQPLSSVESPHNQVIHLPANHSNHVSMVMEPIEKMQQLPSSRFLSSNQDFSSEDAISSNICVGSSVFQNQASEKAVSNLEVGSRTHRLVPPISNMVIDSHVSGVVRAPSSNTRNLSTQRVINNNHPIQTAVQSASRNVQPLCNDPFRNQLETIRKHDEQNVKTRLQMELQLKHNFEKEMKKIDAKFQEEREKTTYLKMMMANAKSNPEFPAVSRMLHLQDAVFNPMLHQLSRQQNATCHSLDSNPSSRGRAAATSQNSYASAGSHAMILSPGLQTSYNTSEIIRDFSPRLPISSASRNLQAGGEASHLPPYGPSTFIPASGVGGILHGMPSHPATPSCTNSISSVSRNHEAGVEIRTPAPHLSAFSTFIPSSCVSGVPNGMPSHPTKPSRINSNSLPSEILQDGGEICTPAHIGGGAPYGMPSRSAAAPSNSPAGYLSQWLAKPMLPPTTISKVGTHRGHGQENIGLSPHTHTLSFKDMHMNPNRR